MILTIRTDKPESEVGLFNNGEQIEYIKWQAHRDLSVTILTKISELLQSAKANQEDLSGIVVFSGPGSYTGLRIGITVANTLSNSLEIPIAGTQSDDWLENGFKKLQNSNTDKLVMPNYGGEAHVTKPKK